MSAAARGRADRSPPSDPELRLWIAAEAQAARANPARVLLIRRAAGVLGVVIAAMGVVVCVGWAIGSTVLTGVAPGLATMKWWAAACFVGLGVGIAVPTVRDTPVARRIALGLGVAVALLGLSFLFEHLTGRDLGHDNIWGLDAAVVHPGRMAETTAASLVLLGVSLALHKVGRIAPAQVLATIPTALGFFAVLGYAFGVSPLYSAGRLASLAAHTAVGLMIAGLAILGLRSDRGYMAIVSSNSAGGSLARRLIPAAVLLPPALGYVALVLLRHRTIDEGFALAMVATAVSVLGAGAVWVQARRLSTVDVERAGTAAALRLVQVAQAQQAALAVALEDTVRRTEAILDTALDAFIGLSDDGRITSWNPAAQRLYGWTAQEALGTRLDELLTVFLADGTPLTDRVDGAFLERAIARGPVSYTVIRKDGSTAEVESRVWGQDDHGGRIYTALVRDIAARRRAERELLDLNRSLDEFAAVAAHDLRGPLAAIRGNLELLEDTALERDDTDDLVVIGRIRRSSDRGLALIDDLLRYARVGRAGLQSARVGLRDLAQGVADEVAARAERPVRIDVEDLPAVNGDAGSLRQVLVNLIENAVNYCPPDREPRIVCAAGRAPDRTQLLLTVTDNGDGVPADERDRIFEMFQRGAGSARHAGTGVGLAFCRRVVERHGGTIWVTDAPGGGSRFALTLPRHFEPIEGTAPLLGPVREPGSEPHPHEHPLEHPAREHPARDHEHGPPAQAHS